MSRRKVILALIIGAFLAISWIHIKTYDEQDKKDVKKILSLRDITSVTGYVDKNPIKDYENDLHNEVNEFIDDKNKDVEKVDEKEENNMLVAENSVAEEVKTNSTNNEIKDNSTPNTSVQEKKISSAPSRGNTESTRRENNELPKGYLNEYVLRVIQSYSSGGSKYPYLLNNDYENYNGVTENIYYKGQLLLKAHPSGVKYSHCSGITFEVFYKAFRLRNEELGRNIDDINGMNAEQLYDFILTWYAASEEKSQSNFAIALERYGLGERIYDMEDLRLGDFIDFSRENNTGHSAVFINWIREGNKIIGFKYWSSQESTKGISYKEEYFNIKDKNGKKYGNVIIDSFIMARAK